MIGQKELWEQITYLIQNDVFPSFCLLIGPAGSGKKLMANRIGKQLGYITVISGTSVAEIREVIVNSYKVAAPTLFVIPDADYMSPAARNALLKVTEEPPNKAKFIITLTDINNTLPTIQSRATKFSMDIYTPNEIVEYYNTDNKAENDIIRDICETPGEVDILKTAEGGILGFYAYVETVVNNIAEVSGANAFKIANKVALKEDTEGYNLKMFWKAFERVCHRLYFNSKDTKYLTAVKLTSQMVGSLRVKAVNRQMLFDKWILRIREEWW